MYDSTLFPPPIWRRNGGDFYFTTNQVPKRQRMIAFPMTACCYLMVETALVILLPNQKSIAEYPPLASRGPHLSTHMRTSASQRASALQPSQHSHHANPGHTSSYTSFARFPSRVVTSTLRRPSNSAQDAQSAAVPSSPGEGSSSCKLTTRNTETPRVVPNLPNVTPGSLETACCVRRDQTHPVPTSIYAPTRTQEMADIVSQMGLSEADRIH